MCVGLLAARYVQVCRLQDRCRLAGSKMRAGLPTLRCAQVCRLQDACRFAGSKMCSRFAGSKMCEGLPARVQDSRP